MAKKQEMKIHLSEYANCQNEEGRKMQRQEHFQKDLPRGLPSHYWLAMGLIPKVEMNL